MVNGRETFWSAVYEPFMTRDVTRHQIREIVARGLERTSGDYRELALLFNIADADFKRFVGLLRRYDCHVALQPFHKRMMKVNTLRGVLEPIPNWNHPAASVPTLRFGQQVAVRNHIYCARDWRRRVSSCRGRRAHVVGHPVVPIPH